MRHLFAIVAVCGAMCVTSAFAQSETIKVTPGQARCLAENIETYEDYETDPVIIVLETCPRPPTNNQLAARLAQRNAGPGLPMPKVGSGDNILILLRSQLACVKEVVTDDRLQTNETGLVEIPLDACSE